MFKFWSNIRNAFRALVRPARRQRRVRFSPSTLQREMMREKEANVSSNPYLNFLADLRRQASEGELSRPRGNVRIARSAGRLWKSMGEEQKRPYREMAVKKRKLDEERRRHASMMCWQLRKKRLARERARKLLSARKSRMATIQEAGQDEENEADEQNDLFVNEEDKGYVAVDKDKVDEDEVDVDMEDDAGEENEEED